MTILEYLKNNIVYLDGGMGSLLQERGLKPGELPERWNISHPDEVTAIHRAYYDAGSNIVYSNTFGANSLKFDSDELEEIIKCALANARRAQKESCGIQEKFVALDIGPLGRLLKPYGDLDFEDAVSVFAETAKYGEKYGADLIVVETMNDSYETKAALLAVKENSSLPVFVTNAYGGDGKLMTGANAAAMVAMLEGMGADAIGVNCSLGPKALFGIVRDYLKYASVPVIMKPNAGLPELIDGKTVYTTLPDDFSADVAEMIKEGVRVAGGCCGTTPAYIKALVDASEDITPVPITEKNYTVTSSYTHAVFFGEKPVLIGERINPTGKKRFRQALIDNDITYILNEGIKQADKGVDVLDVNVGLPDIDEPSVLKNVVFELQSVTNLPLQIDTTDPVAMENALRIYNGKAMVNSVNGKDEVMDLIFPLVKKYGGAVIALTLDESGLPATVEDRLIIADKIIKKAAEYGIKKKDIIFDPLALTVSAEPTAALMTLGAVEAIKKTTGCNTSLGVSNVSFGLPKRELINSTFFAMALERGLSAAIMNPFSIDMMKVYKTFVLLRGMDDNCSDYISFTEEYEEAVASAAPVKAVSSASGKPLTSDSELKNAVIKGLKKSAGEITRRLINEGADPLKVINDEVIPALDVVGIGFEKKTVYLPQLLMSAEAAGEAFDIIKSAVASSGTKQETKCTFVIATVQGDIHDIGKNIVKLLLENYGFDVIDLGRDVPPETVVQKVIETHAPLAGLSALMTTTVPAMEETVKLLHEKAPWCKVVVGGAVLTQEYADVMKADKYAKDAMETVRYSDEIFASLAQ